MNVYSDLNGKLHEDISFLNKNEANRFADVSIDDVIQLLQRKKLYKQDSLGEEYQDFKEKMSRLKMAKLPFRVVEIINADWKGEKAITNEFSKNAGIQGGKLESPKRKEQKRALRKKLIDQANSHQETLRLVEQINFLHGTNSSLLPMIHDTLEMIPTGRLLDKGRAPMGGEISQGGMKGGGVNQHLLSADTIRNISRCWTYASSTSNSFNPDKYTEPKTLFLKVLKELNSITLGHDDLDGYIITLLRLKQWNPDAFTRLCGQYRKEIEACKETLKGSCLNKTELLVLKAINYDEERLAIIKGDERIPKDIEAEFGVLLSPDATWENELTIYNPLARVLNESFISIIGYGDTGSGWQFLTLKIFAKELMLEIQDTARDSNLPERIRLKNQLHEKEIKEICLGDENKEFTEENYHLIFEKFVVEPMNAHIKSKMTFYQRRYDRLLSLFDSEPTIRFSKQEREMIEKPFGILLASTKAKASEFLSMDEINFSKAKLGEDIDLAFVTSDNKEKMTQWVNEHGLKGKVTVLDAALLDALSNVPLHHAPDQVQNSTYLMDSGKTNQLNKILNETVFPLYRAPYPNGEKRFWHGVPHAVRTLLLAQVLMEKANEKGIKFNHDIIGLLLAMPLHDVARENDGTDLWDVESGQMAKQVLMKELKLTKEEASFFAACIADKDKPPTSLEQRIIHDGDCIEIMRCLRDPSDFKLEELRMMGILGEGSLLELIQEAKLLIHLTDQGVIKSFLETAKNPYQILLQIIKHSHKEYGKLPEIAKYLYPAITTLAYSTVYQLTEEVEGAIKECFQRSN